MKAFSLPSCQLPYYFLNKTFPCFPWFLCDLNPGTAISFISAWPETFPCFLCFLCDLNPSAAISFISAWLENFLCDMKLSFDIRFCINKSKISGVSRMRRCVSLLYMLYAAKGVECCREVQYDVSWRRIWRVMWQLSTCRFASSAWSPFEFHYKGTTFWNAADALWWSLAVFDDYWCLLMVMLGK